MSRVDDEGARGIAKLTQVLNNRHDDLLAANVLENDDTWPMLVDVLERRSQRRLALPLLALGRFVERAKIDTFGS
jgi:hypothetical protein